MLATMPIEVMKGNHENHEANHEDETKADVEGGGPPSYAAPKRRSSTVCPPSRRLSRGPEVFVSPASAEALGGSLSGTLPSSEGGDAGAAPGGGGTLQSLTRSLEQIGGRVSQRVRRDKTDGVAAHGTLSATESVRVWRLSG
jgi:hypothetical protein